MKDMRTKDERIQDFNDCMEAIESLKEFCITLDTFNLIEELEDKLVDIYEPMAE